MVPAVIGEGLTMDIDQEQVNITVTVKFAWCLIVSVVWVGSSDDLVHDIHGYWCID